MRVTVEYVGGPFDGEREEITDPPQKLIRVIDPQEPVWKPDEELPVATLTLSTATYLLERWHDPERGIFWRYRYYG